MYCFFIICEFPRPVCITDGPAQTQLAHNAQVVGWVLESMRLVDRLTGALLEDGHLSEEEQQRINSQPTLTERAQHLLRVLNCKPPTAFRCFLRALKDTSQAHLFYLLTNEGYHFCIVFKTIILK